MEQVNVRGCFAIADQRRIVVQLASFDWDFSLGKLVELARANMSLAARQIGSGNHEGSAIVELVPLGAWDEAERTLRELLQDNEDSLVLRAAGVAKA
jgi:hypothetical protein